MSMNAVFKEFDPFILTTESFNGSIALKDDFATDTFSTQEYVAARGEATHTLYRIDRTIDYSIFACNPHKPDTLDICVGAAIETS